MSLKFKREEVESKSFATVPGILTSSYVCFHPAILNSSYRIHALERYRWKILQIY
jgi:hypothetical protein